MKTQLLQLILLIIILAVSFSCSKISETSDINIKNVIVEGIALDRTEVTMPVGAFLELTAAITPEDTTNQAVVWDSTDSNIASVTQDGTIIGMAEGSVTITATTDDGDFAAACSVSVSHKTTELSTVSNGPTVISFSWKDPNLADLDYTTVTLENSGSLISTTDIAAGTLEVSFSSLAADNEYTVTFTMVTAAGDKLPESKYTIKTPLEGSETISGTPIVTIAELNAIDLDADCILMEDLDLGSVDSWTPVGSAAAPFTGKLDGAGHTIRSLPIPDADTNYQGLFGYVSYNGDETVIRGLSFHDSSIKSLADFTGTLAGFCGDDDASSSGSLLIEDCHVINAGIIGENCSGGMIGAVSNHDDSESSMTIRNSYVNGVV